MWGTKTEKNHLLARGDILRIKIVDLHYFINNDDRTYTLKCRNVFLHQKEITVFRLTERGLDIGLADFRANKNNHWVT